MPAPAKKRGRPPSGKVNATSAQRTEASKLRRRRDGRPLRNGKPGPPLTPEEEARLKAYDERWGKPHRQGRGTGPRGTSSLAGETRVPIQVLDTPSSSPAPSSSTRPRSNAELLDELDDEAGDELEGDELEESGEHELPKPEPKLEPPANAAPPGAPGATPATSSAITPAPSSSVCAAGPDCPRCAAARDAIVCSTTGEKVHPRIGALAAKGLTGMLIGGMLWGAGRYREDGYRVEPNEWELEETSKAVEEVMFRRFNSMGQIGDLIALLGCIGAVGYRMGNEKPPADYKPPPGKRLKGAPAASSTPTYPRVEGDRLWLNAQAWVPLAAVQRERGEAAE